ncbi:MAG TPA: polysaccharide biosynthesis/export family protein [Vicinamibacterales bacterium]
MKALIRSLIRTPLGGLVFSASLLAAAHPAAAQKAKSPSTARPAPPAEIAAAAAKGVVAPADYVIGPDDQLSILFWRDKDISGDVTVRPDGKISLPLLNDVQAAGLTPEELRAKLVDEAKRYIDDPNATVVVKQINSLKVFITGQVAKPGPYPLTAPTTVLQLISTAGGLNEYAKSKSIVIMRTENARQVALHFNYRDAIKGKNLKQNLLLKAGDTVIVP